jgi:hypothetical protein
MIAVEALSSSADQQDSKYAPMIRFTVAESLFKMPVNNCFVSLVFITAIDQLCSSLYIIYQHFFNTYTKTKGSGFLHRLS